MFEMKIKEFWLWFEQHLWELLDSRFDFGLALEYKYILKSHFVFGLFAEIGLKKTFNSIEVLRDTPDWPDERYHMNPEPKMNQSIGLSIGYRL